MLATADVLVGVFGANLWNALFLRPGSLLVELKTGYGYPGNENGRSLASANSLAYYMADVRRLEVSEEGAGGTHSTVTLTPRFLRRLAAEVLRAYAIEAGRSRAGSGAERTARHDGRCLFEWPPKEPSLRGLVGMLRRSARTEEAHEPLPARLLTPSNQSTCYLDRAADGEWYQRKDSCCDGPRRECRARGRAGSPYGTWYSCVAGVGPRTGKGERPWSQEERWLAEQQRPCTSRGGRSMLWAEELCDE